MNDEFRHLHMPPELACTFLAVFSRMEYALKATGTYALDRGGKVSAHWDGFANDIDQAFLAIADKEFTAAVEYLLDHPPRKQALDNGRITFIDQVINNDQTKAQQTLLMVRTVRNNLFHGSKHNPNDESEPGRNRLLVSHSLTVLKCCSVLHENVRAAYEY